MLLVQLLGESESFWFLTQKRISGDDAVSHFIANAGHNVVLQVLSYGREVDGDWDPMLLQYLFSSNTRKFKQLGGVEGARCDNYFLGSSECLDLAVDFGPRWREVSLDKGRSADPEELSIVDDADRCCRPGSWRAGGFYGPTRFSMNSLMKVSIS